MAEENETISDMINDIAIRRLIAAGYHHPILDYLREVDKIISEIFDRKEKE